MTIEEAINILKKYINYDNPYVPDFYTMEEAIKVIIEALEQEPCEDAVSRQAVLDEIDKRFDLAKPFKQLIKSMPPVTPQQKMGRWAVLKDEYGDVIEDVCSNCDKNGNRKWAFCPFCGCKMQEVEND